jgi:hypothetical protein
MYPLLKPLLDAHVRWHTLTLHGQSIFRLYQILRSRGTDKESLGNLRELNLCHTDSTQPNIIEFLLMTEIQKVAVNTVGYGNSMLHFLLKAVSNTTSLRLYKVRLLICRSWDSSGLTFPHLSHLIFDVRSSQGIKQEMIARIVANGPRLTQVEIKGYELTLRSTTFS